MELFDYEKEHLARVRAGLPECMVLLKKNGAFPLENACPLAAYGSGVRHTVRGGTGSGEVNAHFTVSIEQGLENAGFTLTTKNWLDGFDGVLENAKASFRKQLRKEARAAHQNVIMYAMGAVMPQPEYDLPLDPEGDAAIYVVSRISGEGSDRRPVPGDVLLTESERRDILALNRHFPKFMLVLNVGGPVDLTPVQEVENILVLSQLGAETGNALADVLLGKTYPSGKLTTTWAGWDDYCPDISLGDPDDTYYNEGIYVGYRYFSTIGREPLYPFGHGLGYSDFSISENETTLDGSTVTVTAKVGNTGRSAGKEIAQVYVTTPEKALKKPYLALAGFAKTGELLPGESDTLRISFDLADLASFDESRHVCLLEEGDYIIRLGTSSTNTEPVCVVTLPREVILRKVRAIVSVPALTDCVYERAGETGVGVNTESVKELAHLLKELPHFLIDPDSFTRNDPTYDLTYETDPQIAALSDEELSLLSVGHFSEKGGLLSVIGEASANVAGAAGESIAITRKNGASGETADASSDASALDSEAADLDTDVVRSLVMADGPAGLRLAREFYRNEDGAHAIGGTSIPETMLDALSGPARTLLQLISGGKHLPKGAVLQYQYCTSLPIGTALAQSWNPAFAEDCGDIVGEEMERFGVHLWLAPALNIHRSILCGRNFEYFSEDPLISGKMAAALTRGVQSHPHCGVTIKHFTANNQETNRYFNNSQMSERTLREIYLKGFDICIREAQPLALMTSYNLLNAIHTSESRALVEDHLRAEVGYAGLVMSDWVLPMPNHGSRYGIALADRASAAGSDIFMPGSKRDYENVLRALKEGRLSRKQLEINGTRILKLSKRLTKK